MTKRLCLAVAVALVLVPPVSMAQEAMTLAKACGHDIDRLCAGVPPGEGRIKACIKAHITELSAPCFDALLGAVAGEP